ncbi:MAG: hypothetical protein WCH31_02945 [Actinomycetes bacterium]
MSASRVARAAIVTGTTGLAIVPLAAVAASLLGLVSLIRAGVVAAPAAVVVGLAGVAVARRARFALDRSVWKSAERVVRLGRFLSWAAVYLGVTALLSLAFYGLLRATS